MNTPSTSRRKQTGLSLIELMVAMVIGLIISLSVFGVLQNYEGRKRTTTSVNDINQSGNYAIFMVDKLLRSAGTGIVQLGGSIGCSLSAPNIPITLGNSTPFPNLQVSRLIPALIVPGAGANNSDAIIIMGGNSGFSETPTALSANSASAELSLSNTLGFSANDLILLTHGRASDGNCMLTKAAPGPNNPTATKITIVSTYGNPGTNYKASNNPDTSANALSLGNSTDNPPNFLVIGANNNVLSVYDLLSATDTPLSEGVQGMYALYGVSNDDGSITWTKAIGNYSPANLGTTDGRRRLLSIKAIRIGLILRTSLLEKEEVAPEAVSVFGNLGSDLTISQELSGEALRYRYRTLESTIPLRNLLNVSNN